MAGIQRMTLGMPKGFGIPSGISGFLSFEQKIFAQSRKLLWKSSQF